MHILVLPLKPAHVQVGPSRGKSFPPKKPLSLLIKLGLPPLFFLRLLHPGGLSESVGFSKADLLKMLKIGYLFPPPLLKVHMWLKASKCGVHATFSAQMLRVGGRNKQAEEISGGALGGFLQVMACAQGLLGYTELVLAFLSL